MHKIPVKPIEVFGFRVVKSEMFVFFQLCKELPARTVGRAWQLAYSTSRHGASLKSLYRKLSSTDSPVLIVIKDSLDEVKTVTETINVVPPGFIGYS